MIDGSQFQAWVFVSHSSDDLPNVRKVRNYLEERGASPLIFHLLGLKQPEEFWPIIEREISERNFFLYCESEAAKKSEWVQRERRTVDKVRGCRPIRIGRVRVDLDDVDTASLDSFLRRVRVFPSFSRQDRAVIGPFLEALEQNGFIVFSDAEILPGRHWRQTMESELALASKDGWVVPFLSQASMQSLWAKSEVEMATQLGARFVPVLIEKVQLPSALARLNYIDATSDLQAGPQRLVQELLTRN